VFGETLVGRGLEVLLILSVLSSAAASTQTTILPTARTTLAMGAYKALPDAFARIHPRYLTPTVSTIAMGVVSIAFYVGLTVVSENVLGDSIAAVGLMIAFYYGITGFAAVWFYRRDVFTSVRNFFEKGLGPFLGGAMLLGAFVIAAYQYADPEYGSTTLFGIGGVFIIGIGALLLGVVVMLISNMVAPAFFRGETLAKRTSADLVLVVPSFEDETLRLPDSGLPDLVIAPDLSNLPEGMLAEDLETGVTVADTGELRALEEGQELPHEGHHHRPPHPHRPASEEDPEPS
jgi:amino acid transporter